MQVNKLKVEDREIAYFVEGSGPYLLGMSGFGCTHYNFLGVLPELAKQFTVVLIDNRGMGLSSKTNSPYKISDLALDALLVMNELKCVKFGLMGISMGGFIAQEILKMAPEKVQAVSFMCTLSSDPEFIQPIKITEEGLRQFNTIDPVMQAQYSTMATVHPTLKELAPETYDQIVQFRIDNKADLEELIRQNNAACEFLDEKIDLTKIHCPTLAMAASEDRFVDPKNVFAFAKLINGCQTAFIEQADHFFFLEKTKDVSKNLIRFFTETLK